MKRISRIMVAIFCATTFLTLITSAWGQPQNLLSNGGFEVFWVTTADNGERAVGTAWTPYWVSGNLTLNDVSKAPVFQSSAGIQEQPLSQKVHSGNNAQFWTITSDILWAGVYQRVTVTPNTTLRLSAWTIAWSGDSSNELRNEAWVRQRVGIDPTGGDDPLSESIIWSNPAQFVGQWGTLAVEAVSKSDHVTVYLSSYPNAPKMYNQVVYDTVELALVAFAAPTRPPVSAGSVDPLLIGLVVGQGVAPGKQGVATTITPVPLHSADTTSAKEQADFPARNNFMGAGLVIMILMSLAVAFRTPGAIFSTKEQ